MQQEHDYIFLHLTSTDHSERIHFEYLVEVLGFLFSFTCLNLLQRGNSQIALVNAEGEKAKFCHLSLWYLCQLCVWPADVDLCIISSTWIERAIDLVSVCSVEVDTSYVILFFSPSICFKCYCIV